jgi:polar amino acid transport system substrate-binding protein
MKVCFVKSKVWLFAVLIGLLAATAVAEGAGRAITVGVSFSSKPYVFDNNRGIIPDIIKEALLLEGYQPQFVHLSNQQLKEQFNEGRLDAVAIGSKHMQQGYFSAPYVEFANSAITLASKALKIDNIGDLSGLRVLAFSEASKYLGQAYAQQVATLAGYREISAQWQQVKELLLDETDVVIADGLIFKYYLKQLVYRSQEDSLYLKKVHYHPILPANHYRAVFRDQGVRDAFDAGLKTLHDNGRMEYLQRYNRSLVDLY